MNRLNRSFRAPNSYPALPSLAGTAWAAAFVLLAHTTPAAALDVTGITRAIYGDTLKVEGLSVRLHGIDAS